MKKTLAFFLAASMSLCLLSACGSGATTTTATTTSDETTASSEDNSGEESSDGLTELTVGIPNDLDSLDPYLMTAAGTREVMLNIYEGLVKADATGTYVPAVASDWTVSEDGLVYTFTLRDGVLFHNGETVTTDDVLYSFEQCAATSVTETVVTALSNAEVTADGNDIIVTLAEPSGDFIANVSNVFIIPADYTDTETMPIGTGPYKFVSRSVQENVILEKNYDYYGTPAYIDNITIKVYEDSTAMVTALNSGALDMVNHLQIDQINTLTNGYNVLSDNMNLVAALYLNNAIEPFNNEEVRQALNYAIDVDQIIEIASGGYGQKVGSSMYPNFTKYFDESLNDAYPYDPDKAVEMLTEAGYGDGLSFSITVPSNYEHPYGDMAQVIIEQLAQVGVTAEIEWVDWSTWLERVYAGRDFETTICGFTASTLTASALLSRWQSDAGNNMISYSNAEYDETYAAATAATDDDEATALYKECLKILSDTAANVYIQDLGEFVVLNPAYDGYTFYPMYMIDLSTIQYVGE